jgi:HK97 family phage prohead protease
VRWREWLGLGSKTAQAATMSADQPARRFALGWEAFPWWEDQASGAFARVTREYALSIPAVLKARNVVCGTIASLPIEVLDGSTRPVRSPLLEQIDPDVPNAVTIAMTVEDVLFEGIGWWRILARDATGYPVSARRYDPHVVTVNPPPGTILSELPSGYIPGSTHLWAGGELTPTRDLIRFDSPNPPLLLAAARAIRRAAKLETAAEMYADDPQMRGYFTPKEDADPTDVDVEDALSAWGAARRKRSTGYVPAALDYHETQQLTPADIQLTTLQEKAAVGIANAFGLDAEDVNVSTTSRTYANAVDRRQDKINETYAPLVAALADRLSMGDVTRRGQRVCFDWDRYLEPNPTDRATIDATLIGAEVIVPSEARTGWGLAPMTEQQRAELAPPAPAGQLGAGPMATVTPIRHRADRAATFSDDGQPVGLVFDGGEVEGRFSVDEARRTITGLVLPWGEIGRSDGRRWRFATGALRYSPAHVNQIKLLVDHDNSQSVGRVVRTWADETGQWATFKVARGPAGDAALAMAADGARDGLSVGIGFSGPDHGVTFVDDPTEPGVRLVTSAPWRETSLVALPAFASARTTAVTMAADPSGAGMHCTHCGQIHAAGVTCPSAPAATPPTPTAPAAPAAQPAATFNADPAQPQPPAPVAPPVGAQVVPAQTVTVPASFSADQVAALFSGLLPGRTPPAVQAAPPAESGPAVVNPTALPIPGQPAGPAQVTEQPLYRFDGGRGQRCFSADIFTGFDGDRALQRQAEAFVADRLFQAFANITVSNTTTLNPSINRPDLYVPNLYFSRPIGSTVQGGVVTEVTRQVLPKFSAAAGLTGSHVQGTEPTEGSFSTTSQNVDPTPISGKLIVNREVVDQGGSPQTDQIMWNEMTASYAQTLETRLVDALQALSLSDVAIVGVDGDLQAALLAEFASLQFLRGGDRYRGLALDSALFPAITGAVDGDGRPLFPMINPTNAVGTSATDLSAVRVGSKMGFPAWALTNANGGPDKSFLYVPESVYQWFSPPRRIDLDRIAVARVEIGIWGYSAEFITRNTDVIQLSYTAS